jgi:hypothetical protein
MMIRRLLRFTQRRDAALVLQSFLLLLVVDLGVRLVGVLPILRFIRRRFRKRESASVPTSPELNRLQQAVSCAARHHLYPMRCLPQSLALAWLLARRGLHTDLRFGTRRGDGKLEAHAWLEHNAVNLFEDSTFEPLVPAAATRMVA